MAQAVTAAARGARPSFNSEVELETSANCLVNGFVPKPGTLYLGERGIEFRGDSTFVQRVAWDDVELVSCDIFRGHVRTMDVMRKCPGCGLEREEQEVATISTADFKNGMGLKINGKYYTIVEFQHVKPGKGGAFVRYKIRDLKSGRVLDQTCNAGTKFENVQLITKEMQYLYNDGDSFYFMDNETYEQIPVPADFIGDSVKWFKENDNCQLLYADTELLGVQPPMFIEVEITETDPGFKGDTVQGGTKPATIETGAVIQVPMYLNQGEVIKVDTRDGKFVSRV